MEALTDIANRAIADYGFRQVVMWSPDDIVAQWELSDQEAEVLRGLVRDALEALPIPVQPQDIPAEQDRFAALISQALGS